MFPVMRLVFAAVGAFVGVNIGPGGGWFFSALVGACIGFGIAEFTLVRGRILSLEEEVARLGASLKRRDTEAPVPVRPPAPVSTPDSPQAALDELRLDERSSAHAPKPSSAPIPGRASIDEPASIPAHASMGEPTSIPAPSPGAVLRATLGARRQLGGQARLAMPVEFPWKRVLLWAVLVLSVCFLAWMAYRVTREMGENAPR